jgi:hypothetical protein
MHILRDDHAIHNLVFFTEKDANQVWHEMMCVCANVQSADVSVCAFLVLCVSVFMSTKTNQYACAAVMTEEALSVQPCAMYVCMYLCICMCVYIHTHIHIYIYIYIHVLLSSI